MGASVKDHERWRRFRWYLACVLNRIARRHIAAMGLLVLWATLIAAIDCPLLAETRQMTLQIAPYTSLKHAKQHLTSQPLAPRDLTQEFTATLPEFDKSTEQLRALNALADKNGVVITRADYRYEQMPAMPIKKLTLRMDLRGDMAQQRGFLRATLNAFPNLSIARLAYAKSSDGSNSVEQKLDVNLYYRAHPKGAA
jgi:hypothetical protein